MLYKSIYCRTIISCNDDCFSGESLERQIEKMLVEKTPIESVAPMIYTERKQGVLPEYDIRTDRWLIAQNAMTQIAKSNVAKRMQRLNNNVDNDKLA